ncbi:MULTISPECIES: ATP-dependent DNA helicase UvrD2 [unclassified Nocardioides]|uniref:ATP-dependent DNA helicase UvrD2 n=1 Tax=unclassified Nocardioides TaxID=2615069 RepID=UPI0009F0B05D|nr:MULTISPECIES: ATP-dependent DNA helicase UvrD2 [unclassified Nocardioides]GAW49570.1 UvrD/REP helicase [Nocardioides sp. PD653-B2]GAW57304.1 UvrD/REP helicase [Nocardioides sp. PD653]
MALAPDLLAALDPEQRQVAEALRGPVRVLAGAGTGKTRAITHRIAHGVATGVYAPTEVLAVTFTTRAAGEMRGRLRALGAGPVQARTFHSAALRQLRYFWPHAHGTELPTLIESKIGLLATAVRRQRLPADQALLRDLASEVEWAKVSNVHPDDYAAVALARGRTVTGHDPETVGRVFGSYEEVKRGQGRMDMEDVLLLTAGMLADDERVAAQVRRQYKWFVVDEFQDVSPIQSALLDLWLGGRNELCVVGDPAQTIYSFAGANADYLRDFRAKFPGTTSIELVRNYRSTPEVVTAANALLAGSASRGVELRAQRPSGPTVTYTPRPDEVAEAEAVAAQITRLRDAGRPLSEVAILFRINALSEAFEEALSARGLPYVVRGAARFFDRPEVREAVTRLRGAARSGEAESSDSWVDAVHGTLAGMGWSAEAPTARGQTRDRWESWQALFHQATEFALAHPDADLNVFVDDLDRRASEQHAPVADGVTLATFHAAKGLEWDTVFLCGLQDGTLPITYADTPAAIEEERRLLYVGMTRARVDLALSWAQARNPGGRATRKPSRFLDRLLPDEARGAREAPRGRKVMSCRECGKPLSTGAEKKRGRCADCPASYDEELFERLREWRRDRAGEEEVPAFVVFTDATLQLIAEHKPRSPEALLRISGIGQAKLERYGEDVLTVVG